MKKYFPSAIAVSLVALVLIALFAVGRQNPIWHPITPSPTASLFPIVPTPTSKPLPPTNTPEPAEGWSKHDDQALQFSIRYPPEWFLYPASSEDSAAHTILTNFDLIGAEPDETGSIYLAGGIRVEVGEHPSLYDETESLTEWAKENFFGEGDKIEAESDVINGEIAGKRLEFLDGSGIRWIALLYPRDRSVLILLAGPAGNDVELVLSTLRLR